MALYLLRNLSGKAMPFRDKQFLFAFFLRDMSVRLIKKIWGANLRAGMTLVEVVIGMAITTFMCVGLYSMGLYVVRFSQSARIETEARAYATGLLEELIAAGMQNIATLGYSAMEASEHMGTLGDVSIPINCTPSVVWHTADGTVVTEMDEDGFAEVHVQVSYTPPRMNTRSDAYATIISN
jgi:Tfp pilus assembly protein PilV